jgi:hypothetical protein
MAGSYINIYEDKVDMPDNLRKEFIKFTFNTEIRKNT